MKTNFNQPVRDALINREAMIVINYHQIPELFKVIQPKGSAHSDLFYIIRLEDHVHSMNNDYLKGECINIPETNN
jgi:hypothetical protein